MGSKRSCSLDYPSRQGLGSRLTSVGPADAQRAMRVIRANVACFRLDAARVGVTGFSAGGFLTASIATRLSAPFYAPVDASDQLSARPLLTAPIYPVQSADPLMPMTAWHPRCSPDGLWLPLVLDFAREQRLFG